MSGGQAQRLGNARSVFNGGLFFVFDEVTSALDGETRDLVLESINSLGNGISMLIISHQPEVLSSCSKIYCLDGGLLKDVTNTYQSKSPQI